MLLVCVPVLLNELEKYKSTLLQSFSNFIDTFSNNVAILVVIQSKIPGTTPDWLFFDEKITVETVSWLSVSRARNLGLDFARSNDFKKIIFHDVSLLYPGSVCNFFSDNYDKPLVKACAKFDISPDQENKSEFKYVKLGKLEDYYVWIYMFDVSLLPFYFDERFGPADDTIFKSGEDFIFMACFFKNFKNKEVLEFCFPRIFHPARPHDFSKHLYYALGQGKMYQVLLKYHFEPKYFFWFVLFICNAVVRAIMLKPNSFKILKKRLKGFFS